MKSVAFQHFPRVVVESERFLLFNPILRKRYENRPEERIRLQWVEYLLLQTDWKKSRIGFELPVNVRQNKNTLRADLILYSDSMQPKILIECKSDSVKLNQKAAEQAARYNSQVQASQIVLTNGIEDFWFDQKQDDIQPSKNTITGGKPAKEYNWDFNYWNERGFCSSNPSAELSNWLPKALNTFWNELYSGKRHFLDFQQSLLPVPMNQYYKVFEMDNEMRLAVSFIGFDSSDNYIVGILNSKGTNRGIMAINLDIHQKGKQDSVMIFKENQQKAIAPQNKLSFNYSDFDSDEIKNLPQTIMKFFD